MADTKQDTWQRLQREHNLTDDQIQGLQREAVMQEKDKRDRDAEFREGSGPFAQKVRQRLKNAGIPFPVRWEAASGKPAETGGPIRHIWEFYSKAARNVVLELVNAQDTGISRFRKTKRVRFFLAGESDAELLGLRDELRRHWNEGLDYFAFQLASKPHIPPKPGIARWHEFTDRRGIRRYVPILFDLPRAVSIAALEIAPYASVCANPECPSRYFVRQRSTQRFCDAKCAEYGQREHKRDWWKGHGDEWRKQRKAAGRKPNRTREE